MLEVFYVLYMKLKFLYLSTIYDFGPLCKLEIVEEKGSKSWITFSIQLVIFQLFLRFS